MRNPIQGSKQLPLRILLSPERNRDEFQATTGQDHRYCASIARRHASASTGGVAAADRARESPEAPINRANQRRAHLGVLNDL